MFGEATSEGGKIPALGASTVRTLRVASGGGLGGATPKGGKNPARGPRRGAPQRGAGGGGGGGGWLEGCPPSACLRCPHITAFDGRLIPKTASEPSLHPAPCILTPLFLNLIIFTCIGNQEYLSDKPTDLYLFASQFFLAFFHLCPSLLFGLLSLVSDPGGKLGMGLL